MKEELKKQSRLRLLVQCLSFAFHNGYVSGWANGKIYTGNNKAFCLPGLNCYSCPGAIGACPIGSLQAVLDSSGFHLSLYVIGFIGLVGVFCGRFVCGWLCPFGLIQDLMYRIPLFRKVKNLPGHKYLRYLRFGILAVFVILLPMGIKNQAGVGQPWFCEYLCPSGTLLGGIPLAIANESIRQGIGIRFFWKLFLLLLILIAAVYSDRPFCKYVCPLGALYGICNPVSVYRLIVNKDTCVSCGACQKICGADIRVWETPNSIDCIRCGKCMKTCPTGSIYTTFSRLNKNINANSEETVNAEITVETAKPAETGKTAETTKLKTVLAAIAALLCIGTSVYVLYSSFVMLYVYCSSGSFTEVVTFLVNCFGLIVSLIPAIITLILGIKLIQYVFLRKEDPSLLSAWPLRNLKLSACCLAVYYIVMVVLMPLKYNQVFVGMFIYPIIYGVIGEILLLSAMAANLLSWLLIRRWGTNKTDTKKTGHGGDLI